MITEPQVSTPKPPRATAQAKAEAVAAGAPGEKGKRFGGKYRLARVRKFNAALERKKESRKAQRKLKDASKRRNRGR